MMRLPRFRHYAPPTVVEAARILAGEGSQAMLIAGGTDVLPNMKRRQQEPAALVSVRRIEALRALTNGAGLRLGAGLTLTQVASAGPVRAHASALYQAAAQVATPHLRNRGTLGGNICLDTRCHYYDQNYEWRKAIDFCMKKEGVTCWVATASKRCLAISSTDTAPALIALGARVRLLSPRGERELALTDLYHNDGIEYLLRKPDEILTEIVLPASAGWRSCYWKLRRRGSFDFPVLGVAAAGRFLADGSVADLRVVLGAVASRPLVVAAADLAIGQRLSDELIAAIAAKAFAVAKPMDNADFTLHWRKQVVGTFVGYALRELRGDDLRATRLRIARQQL